ncbi:MAG: Sec-independent protein translocase subunit TatA/TatB [Thermacetogeniaceae bacterium]|jgi:sec-independent protein translocase protein TatA|nr:twin-arginine translocase TatA/TatE family subunit [Thermoanaerobacterales bacterium]
MFGLLPSIGPWELAAILFIVLIIFGPGKLPAVGKSIANGIREFRKATKSDLESAEGAKEQNTAEE